MDQFDLRVTDIVAETALIRAIKLARPHGEPLPSWEAGAHVKVRLPDGNERSYSLINTSLDPAATTRPHTYRLGVRLEQPSQGGSQFMHALRVGDVVQVKVAISARAQGSSAAIPALRALDTADTGNPSQGTSRHRNLRRSRRDLSIPDIGEQPAVVVDGVAHLDLDGRSHDCPDVSEQFVARHLRSCAARPAPHMRPSRIVLPGYRRPFPMVPLRPYGR